MAEILIIGSGPAAAAVALAAVRSARDRVVVVDPGERLEASRQDLLDGYAGTPPARWPPDVVAALTQQPVAEIEGELPQKRLFGSDFPFRDRGQLAALSTVAGGNSRAVSAAFGGFSNVWGAQVMPFSRRTFDDWPITYDELVPHYRTILDHIPFAGADDDYSELFPLLAGADALPTLSPPAAAVLRRYAARRSGIRRRGVTLGAARLAMRASACVECGLCLTGCPYHLIYSASQTLSDLIAAGSVVHRPGLLALRVGEDHDGPWARVRSVDTGQITTLRADRVFVACGGIGSTRLVLGSARPDVTRVELAESVQLVLPFLSTGAQPDPRSYSTFTLNQFNVLVQYGREGLDLAQFHLYPYNPAFDEALPSAIAALPPLKTAILRRTVAALGYLPSWASPGIELTVSRRGEELPGVHVGSRANPATARVLRRVLGRLLSVAPALDLWPGIPALTTSGPAKSYHFGASFPHVDAPRAGELETDSLGRLAEWDRIHMVDGAVFSSVPATTFTLTVMSNAHRIASTVLA